MRNHISDSGIARSITTMMNLETVKELDVLKYEDSNLLSFK